MPKKLLGLLKYRYTCKLVILGILLTSTSCAVKVSEVPTPVILKPTFSNSGTQVLNNRWWQHFADPQLNALIEQALKNNFSLKAAFNRLQQTYAVANKSGAELIPNLNATIGSSQTTTDKFTNSNFSLGILASYEIDLWGRIRSNINANTLDVMASKADLHTAALSLSAEIALTWYRLIEQRKQLILLEQQIKINQNLAQVVEVRFQAGMATAADVLQQRQALASIEGDRHPVLASIRVFEHQLSILLGQDPTQLDALKATEFPQLPALPKTGLSADLIQRRPDLQKAYLTVQAADQRIAVAIADRLPKFSLSANMNTAAPDLQSLFNNWLATIAGNLLMPLVDGSRRLLEVERVQAKAREALNNYASVLLQASKEVEDALIQEQQQQNFLQSLIAQVQLSEQATEQIRLRYRHGAIDFLRVLSVFLSQQGLERQQLRAERELIEYRVHLYRALAGSFELPTSLLKQQ